MNYDLLIDRHTLEKFVNYYHPFVEENTDPRILHVFKSPDFRITVYNSRKVLFQGKDAYQEYALWAKHLGQDVEPEIDVSTYVNEHQSKRVIGADEVGTGDLFGPVVVAAALVKPDNLEWLDEQHVRDSKTLGDAKIREIAPLLMQKIPHQVLVLPPKKFNALTKEGYNMNKIKAYLHNHAIKKMVTAHKDFDEVILDEFCSKDLYFSYLEKEQVYRDIFFVTKAESVHKSVAVASIIARYVFLCEMDKLSETIGMTLPKGAGAPAEAIAKLIYLQKGKAVFDDIAKVNFKTFERIWNKE